MGLAVFARKGNASIKGGDEIAVDERLPVVTAFMQMVVEVQSCQLYILLRGGNQSCQGSVHTVAGRGA